jgi:outer membrane protein assembly factor BamB
MNDTPAGTKMPEHPTEPFIRILGESLGRDADVGQELNWRIVTHTVAPNGVKTPLVRHVEIHDENDCCVFTAPPLPIGPRSGDLERFDDQHQAMDCDYEPVIDTNQLESGVYTVHGRLESESGEIVSQTQLPITLGQRARLLSRIGLCWDGADDHADRLYLGGIVRVGDVDGDGQQEIVHGVGARHLCVYTLDGQIRWRYDDPEGVMIYNTAALRVFDIDGDGKAEIMCARGPFGDLKLTILNGQTGEIKRQSPIPFLKDIEDQAAPFIERLQQNARDLEAWDGIASSGHTVRFLAGGEASTYNGIYGAKIFIANFRGLGRKDLLIQLGDQNCVTLLAMDGDLNLLWHHRVEDGYAGHNPAIYDIDGDGRDEVAVGTRLLDHDGGVIWKKRFDEFAAPWEDDHIDQAQAGPFGPNGEIVIVYSCRVCVDALTGKTIWIDPTWHGQEVQAAKILGDGNYQFVFYDREYRHSGHLCHGNWFDVRQSDGRKIWSYRHGALHAHRLLDWNGDGLREVSFGLDLQRRPVRPNLGIFDGRGNLTSVLPWYGFGADVDNDGYDELVTWTQWPDVTDKIEIYGLDHPDTSRGRAEAAHENEFSYNEPD